MVASFALYCGLIISTIAVLCGIALIIHINHNPFGGKSMGIFGKLFGVKADRLKNAILKAEAENNPDDLSEAQLREYQEKWEEITTRLGVAKQRLEKERRDVTALEESIQTHVAGATLLQKKRDVSSTEEEKAKHQANITTMVNEIKTMQAKLETEKAEATTAEEHFNLLQTAADRQLERIKSHKKTMLDAKTGMERAKVKLEMAKDREADAKLVAGLVDETTSPIGTALDALNKVAQEMENEAAIANQRAEMLNASVEKPATNDDIAAVLKEAKGIHTSADPISTDDFLKQFKK